MNKPMPSDTSTSGALDDHVTSGLRWTVDPWAVAMQVMSSPARAARGEHASTRLVTAGGAPGAVGLALLQAAPTESTAAMVAARSIVVATSEF